MNHNNNYFINVLLASLSISKTNKTNKFLIFTVLPKLPFKNHFFKYVITEIKLEDKFNHIKCLSVIKENVMRIVKCGTHLLTKLFLFVSNVEQIYLQI